MHLVRVAMHGIRSPGADIAPIAASNYKILYIAQRFGQGARAGDALAIWKSQFARLFAGLAIGSLRSQKTTQICMSIREVTDVQ